MSMKRMNSTEISIILFLSEKMEAKITKTYLGSTGSNYKYVMVNNQRKVSTTETATFHVDFPADFVSSTNRRFITVMSPCLVWGGKTVNNVYIPPSLPIKVTKSSRIADNMYIMHCSFIHRDPFHDQAVINVNDPKRKYKKYEYKGCEDGFDITFTDYVPAFDVAGWSIGLPVNGNLPNWTDTSFDETTLTNYFQQLYINNQNVDPAALAEQCMNIYYDIVLGSEPAGISFYRNNQRFKKNSKTEYATEYNMYDIVLYVIEQNNLVQALEETQEITQKSIDGDYYVYDIATHYYDYNINRKVSYHRYIQYKIFKDLEPWYYYAEFMVEF